MGRGGSSKGAVRWSVGALTRRENGADFLRVYMGRFHARQWQCLGPLASYGMYSWVEGDC